MYENLSQNIFSAKTHAVSHFLTRSYDSRENSLVKKPRDLKPVLHLSQNKKSYATDVSYLYAKNKEINALNIKLKRNPRFKTFDKYALTYNSHNEANTIQLMNHNGKSSFFNSTAPVGFGHSKPSWPQKITLTVKVSSVSQFGFIYAK